MKQGELRIPKLLTLEVVARKLDLSQPYLRAVKVAMGKQRSARYLDPAEVRAWLLANPDFRMRQVTGKRWNPPPRVNPLHGTADTIYLQALNNGLPAGASPSLAASHECTG